MHVCSVPNSKTIVWCICIWTVDSFMEFSICGLVLVSKQYFRLRIQETDVHMDNSLLSQCPGRISQALLSSLYAFETWVPSSMSVSLSSPSPSLPRGNSWILQDTVQKLRKSFKKKKTLDPFSRSCLALVTQKLARISLCECSHI